MNVCVLVKQSLAHFFAKIKVTIIVLVTAPPPPPPPRLLIFFNVKIALEERDNLLNISFQMVNMVFSSPFLRKNPISGVFKT